MYMMHTPCSGNAKWEPGAVVCRASPSWVRFGTFQLPASRGGAESALVQAVADHVIKQHFPHLKGVPPTIVHVLWVFESRGVWDFRWGGWHWL